MYVPFAIHAAPHDLARLHSGSGVSFPHHKLGSGTNFLLTPSQVKKAHHAIRTSRPFHLRMNKSQFRHNAMNGRGIWDSFKKAVTKGVSAVKSAVTPLRKIAGEKAKQILPGLIEKGTNKLLDKVATVSDNPLLQVAVQQGRNKVGSLSNTLGNKIGSKISGSGLPRGTLGAANIPRPVPRSQQGAGVTHHKRRRRRGRGLFMQT